MKEQDLKELKFKKIKVLPEESGCKDPYYYYTWKPNNKSRFCIISDANDNVKDECWTVEIFELDIVISKKKDLKQLINIIKKITC